MQEAINRDAQSPGAPPEPSVDFGTVNMQGYFGRRTFSYPSRRHANHTFTFVQTSTSGKNLLFRCRACYNRESDSPGNDDAWPFQESSLRVPARPHEALLKRVGIAMLAPSWWTGVRRNCFAIRTCHQVR